MQLIVLYVILIHFQNSYCAIGDKAKAKCIEYSKYVNEKSGIVDGTIESMCGIEEVPLIIGGEKANEMEFPHMAAIGFGNSPDFVSYECGGSLISELYILTAAHCTQSREKGPSQKVKMGMINYDENDEDVIEKLIIERILHPGYKPPLKYNDIALLLLDSPVKFSAFVRPACINSDNIKEKTAIATGWGNTKFDEKFGSKVLMKVSLDLINGKDCQKFFSTPMDGVSLPGGISEEILCAGKLEGGKDTCQGDSGGPLSNVLENPYCMYNVMGVVSFGKFCGFANSPGIYSNVSHFVEWIESIVWP